MSVTSGFYNSDNHDRRYTTLELASIFDGVITDGVYAGLYKHMNVRPGSGMEVIVEPGRSWFNHTWTLVDSDYPVRIDPAEVVLDRIDAIVNEVNGTRAVRNNRIVYVKGTPASVPTKPNMVHSDVVHQYPLCYIKVVHGVNAVGAENIEKTVGTSECPFVTGVLSTVTTDELISQWEARFEAMFAELQNRIDQLVQGSIPDGAVSSTYSLNVKDSDWVPFDDGVVNSGFINTVPVVGIKPSDKPIVDIDFTWDPDWLSGPELVENWSHVYRITAGDGELKFYSDEHISTWIPVKVMCVRK